MSDNDDGLRGRTLRGIAWVAIEKWGVRLVSLGVFVILTRTVDPEDFGLLSITTVVTMFLLVFVDAGFQKSLIQRRTLDPLDATTAFWTSLLIAVLLYIGVFFTAPLLESLYGMEGLAVVLRVISLGLIVNALASVPAALLERDMAFRPLAVRNIIGTFVGGLVAVPMAILGFGVWALVAQSLATSSVAALALWITVKWRPQFGYSLQSLKVLWRFGVSVFGIEFLNKVQDNLDKIVIGAVFGEAILGVYYVAQRLILIVTELITTVIAKLSLTTFSKLQDDKARLSRGFNQLTFASALVAVPVFGLIATFSSDIIVFISGEQWANAAPIMLVLAIASAFAAIMYFDKNTLLAVGHPRQALTLAVVESIFTIVLIIVATPLGILAIAAVRLVRLVGLWPYRQWLLKKYAGVQVLPYLMNVLVAVASFVVPFGVQLLVAGSSWAGAEPRIWAYVAPMSVIMLVIYFLTVWCCCGSRNRELISRTLRLRRK